MTPELRILEHLSYLLECVVVRATGEAKTRLDELVEFIETNAAYQCDGREALVEELRQARGLFRDVSTYGQAGNILCQINREMWDRFMSKGQGHSS